LARDDRVGAMATYAKAVASMQMLMSGGGPIDLTGPFFQSLGTNGRSCGTCHRPAQGWGISADEVKLRFLLTQGLDPILRTNDGSNCDHDIESTRPTSRDVAKPIAC
jgi:hypothetical protein